ncbi:MAG: DUF3179 domain-containing protein [Desulfopila sp.]|jgi:hypothetical protein|nr:DUF3179 domain-containing protein [Desulfopila sp.]
MMIMPLLRDILSFAILLLLSAPEQSTAVSTLNGFVLENARINPSSIFRGGPPRDGIPALNAPLFLPAKQADYLHDDDRVLGIVMHGYARAYPINILNWHEVVNDEIEGSAIVITYCPLCGTGMAFSAVVAGNPLQFGVSGLLYNSDVLLYDTATESLWSQIMGEAVTGPLAGTKLEQMPLEHTSWKHWQKKYPHTSVLSRDTGYVRDYDRNPYGNYAVSEQLYFPVENQAEETLHPKEVVLGVAVGKSYKAYPFSTLLAYGKRCFPDSLNNTAYTILWDEDAGSAKAVDEQGRVLPTIQGYWFAWHAFYPDTEVFTVPETSENMVEE